MLAALHLPKECTYKQFVPKKQFYEHGQFTQGEKDLFVHGIERITLYAQLTRDNTNVPAFKDEKQDYEEISVFLVELKQERQIDKIAKLMMEAIPYPMVLVFAYEGTYNFYGAHQRDNLHDTDKIILEKIYQTGYIKLENIAEQVSYPKFNKQNLFTLYDDYMQALIAFNLATRNVKESPDNEALLEEIQAIEEEIELLRNKMKRENHFNKKMDLNIQIKQLEKQLQNMEG